MKNPKCFVTARRAFFSRVFLSAFFYFAGLNIAPAAVAGLDTPVGQQNLPLSVENNTIINLTDSPWSATVNGALAITGVATIVGATALGNTLAVAGEASFANRIATNGFSPDDLPTGWTGGIRTYDIYASGTVAVGTSGTVNASLNANGLYLGAGGITFPDGTVQTTSAQSMVMVQTSTSKWVYNALALVYYATATAYCPTGYVATGGGSSCISAGGATSNVANQPIGTNGFYGSCVNVGLPLISGAGITVSVYCLKQ